MQCRDNGPGAAEAKFGGSLDGRRDHRQWLSPGAAPTRKAAFSRSRLAIGVIEVLGVCGKRIQEAEIPGRVNRVSVDGVEALATLDDR